MISCKVLIFPLFTQRFIVHLFKFVGVTNSRVIKELLPSSKRNDCVATPMDNLLLFLLVAERLVSFVIGSGGDGNKCSRLAFGDAIVKELEAGEGCLGLESSWV